MKESPTPPSERGLGSRVYKHSDVLQWIPKQLREANIIPLKPNSKQPLIRWKEYQTKRYEGEFPEGCNFAVICGEVSGNLVVVDFDDRCLYEEFFADVTTFTVETQSGGIHLYFYATKPLRKIPKFKGYPIDVQAEGSYVVIPPSKLEGREWRVLKDAEIARVDDVLALLEERLPVPDAELTEREAHKGGEKEGEKKEEEKTLTETKILEIVNLLKPIYREGYRDYIVYFLSGWMKKAGIPYEEAKKVIELLSENDEERKQRLYVLDRTYERAGNPPKKELKGKSGIQEIAEALLGEEQGLELIRKLEELLGKASPFKDSIFSLIDFQRKLYYVANPMKGIIARASERNSGIVYHELIAECCPTNITIYEDPLNGDRKFEVEFNGLVNKKIGPADLESIASQLRMLGVVKHRRLLEDALSSIITAFIRSGKAEIRRELEKPGFYYIDGELKAVKWQPEDFTKEDLRKALLFLIELREKWYAYLGERFTTVVKWGIIAPFSYAIKQIRGTYGVHFPWILLHGSSFSGKSSLGKLIRAIWNLSPDEKSAYHIDTIPRFAKIVSQHTFPVLINEVADILRKDEIKEIIKTSVETAFARGKYHQGTYIEQPALCPMIFTTNKTYPADDALLRRMLSILFTISDRRKKQEVGRFEREVLPRLYDLKYIGFFVFKKLAENPQSLRREWRELSTALLEEAFESAELEVPAWVSESCEGESLEDVDEIVNEDIRATLLSEVNMQYARHFREEAELDERIREVLDKDLLPWAHQKGDRILITTAVLRVLKDCGVDSLRSLAERFGWDYRVFKLGKSSIRA
ncbi:DNA primase, partial [Candidatus Bathyarchaeota archaeon]